MSDKILVADKIHKTYKTGEEELKVLNGASISVYENEYVALLGSSGSGKSTLLHILGSIEKPDSGNVNISINGDRKDIANLSESELPKFRNKNIGFVFQFHHLLPEFNALENMILPALISGIGRDKAIVKAKELADFVGIDHRLNHRPNQLSGGEQQRAAIARALINSPQILLADEPTGNLDDENSDRVMELFDMIKNEYGITILFATHSKALAEKADRKLKLANGIISVI